MRKLAAPDGVQLLGAMTTTFANNLQSVETEPIFSRHGLTNLDPNQWYSANDFLEVLNELATMENFSSNMVAIGMEVGKTVPLPPDMENPT